MWHLNLDLMLALDVVGEIELNCSLPRHQNAEYVKCVNKSSWLFVRCWDAKIVRFIRFVVWIFFEAYSTQNAVTFSASIWNEIGLTWKKKRRVSRHWRVSSKDAMKWSLRLYTIAVVINCFVVLKFTRNVWIKSLDHIQFNRRWFICARNGRLSHGNQRFLLHNRSFATKIEWSTFFRHFTKFAYRNVRIDVWAKSNDTVEFIADVIIPTHLSLQ